MQKFKLCGVSLCTLLAATAANAAGYTCEELIEYTSCMPGYYLHETPVCPDGYMYMTGVCDHTEYSDEVHWNMTEDECYEYGADNNLEVYLESACVQADEVHEDESYAFGVFFEQPIASAVQCNECPKGSICAGGTVDKTACPAGSYCEGTGLSAVSGVCAKGTWSSAGATACSSCPTTGLTDKDGKVVVATTATTGASSASACFIDPNAQFKDAKGIYHFKSNCSFNLADLYLSGKLSVTNAQECYALGGRSWNDERGCSLPSDAQSPEDCAKLADTLGFSDEYVSDWWNYDTNKCDVCDGFLLIWDGNNLSCD